MPPGQLHDPPTPEQTLPPPQSFGALQQVALGMQDVPQALYPGGTAPCEQVPVEVQLPLVHGLPSSLQAVPAASWVAVWMQK